MRMWRGCFDGVRRARLPATAAADESALLLLQCLKCAMNNKCMKEGDSSRGTADTADRVWGSSKKRLTSLSWFLTNSWQMRIWWFGFLEEEGETSENWVRACRCCRRERTLLLLQWVREREREKERWKQRARLSASAAAGAAADKFALLQFQSSTCAMLKKCISKMTV